VEVTVTGRLQKHGVDSFSLDVRAFSFEGASISSTGL